MNESLYQHNDDASRSRIFEALSPDYIKVDERSLADRLNFAARYGDLVNYYDRENQKSGNWSRFYLKDPIILMAVISKVEYESKFENYHQLLTNIENATNTNDSDTSLGLIGENLNQLFLLLDFLFKEINEWVVNMELSTTEYQMKDYVLFRLSDDIGESVWDFLTLWSAVWKSLKINKPDFAIYQDFAKPWQMEGKVRKEFELDISSNLTDFKTLFETVFAFYVQVIDSAAAEFETLLKAKGDHPDTALLIAFLKLLENQQTQLNEFTDRHLDFYYRRILQDAPAECVPDTAFAYCQLKPGEESFELPAGTEFSAGAYPDKTPIVFTVSDASSLNQIQVAEASTVWYPAHSDSSDKANYKQPVYVENHKSPSKILKDQAGQVETWDLLGTESKTTAEHGFAFSTPELYFGTAKGVRSLNIRLTFKNKPEPNLLAAAKIYLSTTKGWLQKTPSKEPVLLAKSASFELTLSPKDPAIQPFKKPPAGFDNQWPTIKILLGESVDLRNPPVLCGVAIDSHVKSLTNIVLANDSGALSPSKPFLPFGQVVNSGNSFYLGSNELFAKKLKSVSIGFTWQTLPDLGFADYYKAYNDFLTPSASESAVIAILNAPAIAELQASPVSKKDEDQEAGGDAPENDNSDTHNAATGVGNDKNDDALHITALHKAESLAKARNDKTPTSGVVEVFNNESFKVSINHLVNGTWEESAVTGKAKKDPRSLIELYNTSSNGSVTDTGNKDNNSQKEKPNVLCKTTTFVIANSQADGYQIDSALSPDLVSGTLKYTDETLSGFFRIRLETPGYGFGSSLYSKVVASTALHNAVAVIEKTKGQNQHKSIFEEVSSEIKKVLSEIPHALKDLAKIIDKVLHLKHGANPSSENKALAKPGEDEIVDKPSTPYAPKAGLLEVDYDACREFLFDPFNQGRCDCTFDHPEDATAPDDSGSQAGAASDNSPDQNPDSNGKDKEHSRHENFIEKVLEKARHEIDKHLVNPAEHELGKLRDNLEKHVVDPAKEEARKLGLDVKKYVVEPVQHAFEEAGDKIKKELHKIEQHSRKHHNVDNNANTERQGLPGPDIDNDNTTTALPVNEQNASEQGSARKDEDGTPKIAKSKANLLSRFVKRKGETKQTKSSHETRVEPTLGLDPKSAELPEDMETTREPDLKASVDEPNPPAASDLAHNNAPTDEEKWQSFLDANGPIAKHESPVQTLAEPKEQSEMQDTDTSNRDSEDSAQTPVANKAPDTEPEKAASVSDENAPPSASGLTLEEANPVSGGGEPKTYSDAQKWDSFIAGVTPESQGAVNPEPQQDKATAAQTQNPPAEKVPGSPADVVDSRTASPAVPESPQDNSNQATTQTSEPSDREKWDSFIAAVEPDSGAATASQTDKDESPAPGAQSPEPSDREKWDSFLDAVEPDSGTGTTSSVPGDDNTTDDADSATATDAEKWDSFLHAVNPTEDGDTAAETSQDETPDHTNQEKWRSFIKAVSPPDATDNSPNSHTAGKTSGSGFQYYFVDTFATYKIFDSEGEGLLDCANEAGWKAPSCSSPRVPEPNASETANSEPDPSVQPLQAGGPDSTAEDSDSEPDQSNNNDASPDDNHNPDAGTSALPADQPATADGQPNSPQERNSAGSELSQSEGEPDQSFSLFPAIKSAAALYVSLDKVAAPTSVRLYFELNSVPGKGAEIGSSNVALQYDYLTDTGWKTLNVLSDTTRSLACSGIIEFELPSDISNNSALMPANFYWMRLYAASDEVEIPVTKVSLLATQGLQLQRRPSLSLQPGQSPRAVANQISAPLKKIAELQSIIQPFPSVGGKPAENKIDFQKRLSQRLRNKGRCSSRYDYCEMIYQAFPDIYYVRPESGRPSAGIIQVGLVKSIADNTSPVAFEPTISRCEILEIKNFLTERTSSQSEIEVYSMRHQAIKISTSVELSEDAPLKITLKNVQENIRQYLAPWTGSAKSTIDLNIGIKRSELIKCITNTQNISALKSLEISIEQAPGDNGEASWLVISDEIINATLPNAILTPTELPIVKAA